jgi:AraC family transcriptional regulator
MLCAQNGLERNGVLAVTPTISNTETVAQRPWPPAPHLTANPAAPHRGELAGWQVRRLDSFIDRHLDETLLTEDLCRVIQRSPGHFTRAFKRTVGQTPHAYITRRRIDRAAQLMLTGDAGLGEIAFACGFSDQAHFSRLFRQATGCTPAAWRRARRQPSLPR